mmetsp:Transcript_37897/g.108999  ORF Transcript_37897/g.108999 Transcript_37897/m.108999 type:complete len:414 (-) Transcript_37897:906-2147(-)
MEKIVDPDRLQHQNNVAQVGALDLRGVVVVQLVLKGPLGIQAEALAWLHPAGAPCALIGGSLRTWHHNERLHPGARIEGVLLAESWVDHVHDVVDRDRRLGDVRRKHHLPCALRGGLEDLRLHVRGERRVDGQNEELANSGAQATGLVADRIDGLLDLLLSREEDQNVARALGEVNLQHGDDASFEVVRLGGLRVVNADGVPPARDVEDRGVVEEFRELLGVKGGGRDDELQVVAEARHVLDQPEQHVGVQGSLVRLVDQHNGVGSHVGLIQEGPKQHAVRHVLDNRLVGSAILEADVVADFVAELDAHLLRHPRGDRHRGDSSRLCAPDLADLCVADLVQVLRQLCCLPGTCLADHNQHLEVAHRLKELRPVVVDWQGHAVLLKLVGLLMHLPQGPHIPLALRNVHIILALA